MSSWRKREIGEVSIEDKQYPESLRWIQNPPKKLFYRGNWKREIFTNCLAVVGSRRVTGYGEAVINKIIPGLVRAGLTIVSGFMSGVDSLGHQVCLDSGGKTIAVFGCGLNQLVPAGNDKLYDRILDKGGLVVSEYEKEIKARLWTFPQRNRIVAGLSKGVLVIEGGANSGSLITAKLAKRQAKPVLAVPGPVTSSQSAGTNWLIKNGAEIVLDSNDVLKAIGMEGLHPRHSRGEKIHTSGVECSEIESRILGELSKEPLETDDLARKLGIDIVILSQTLSLMSLRGLVEEKSGKYYTEFNAN